MSFRSLAFRIIMTERHKIAAKLYHGVALNRCLEIETPHWRIALWA